MAKVSQQQLEECFTEHLPYEISMLRDAHSRLSTLSGAQFERNMLVECFCLHARNLINFFKGKESDFDPRDFTAYGYRLKKRFVGDSYLPRLNEQLSHISRNRTTNHKEKLSGPDFNELRSNIEAEITRMTGDLTPMWHAKCTFGVSRGWLPIGSAASATNHVSIAAVGLTDVRTVGS